MYIPYVLCTFIFDVIIFDLIIKIITFYNHKTSFIFDMKNNNNKEDTQLTHKLSVIPQMLLLNCFSIFHFHFSSIKFKDKEAVLL